MYEAPNKNSLSKQPSDISRSLLIGTAACGSWFVLALVSDILGLFLKVDAGNPLAQGILHSIRLTGGLLIVFGLLPVLLRAHYKTYKTYLGATGILFPMERHHRIVLTAFVLVAGVALATDLAQNGLAGLEEYHATYGTSTLELAAFASLQAAIVEELIFRGIAFSILRRRFPVWVAVLLPAIIFGFAHVSWGLGRVVTTAFMGALFALLRWRTNNLWGPVAMHFLINFGFPIPAWLGWLIAMVLTAGLEITKQFRKANNTKAG
jgi:membrane protease YdiL (CAAX protease family)